MTFAQILIGQSNVSIEQYWVMISFFVSRFYGSIVMGQSDEGGIFHGRSLYFILLRVSFPGSRDLKILT
jgi:hypothetical protein